MRTFARFPAVMLLLVALIATACTTLGNAGGPENSSRHPDADKHKYEVVHTDAEWKEKLTPEQYRILRKAKTERSFSHASHDSKTPGIYRCAACGAPLFHSEAKYDSGTGWPSFYTPVSRTAVATREDNVLFTKRTEVVCGRCGGHLGHVFDDGPKPTGLRYCMNGTAMELDAEAAAD